MSRVLYLKLYNGVSATLWSLVLYYTLEELERYANEDPASLYISKRLPDGMLYPHKFMVRLQLANAAIEVAHSLAGIVPSPLSTLILQFAARLVITSGVSYALPHSPGNYSPAYAVLLMAWALSEIIRYGYYLLKQILDAQGREPSGSGVASLLGVPSVVSGWTFERTLCGVSIVGKCTCLGCGVLRIFGVCLGKLHPRVLDVVLVHVEATQQVCGGPPIAG